MGTYAKVILELESGDIVSCTTARQNIELYQDYDAFAVLVGQRNYNNIKPIFEGRPLTDKQLEKINDFYDGDYYICLLNFTIAEYDAFDLDKPLEFLPGLADSKNPNKHLQHRWCIQDSDTYRSFIGRETSLTDWIERIKKVTPAVSRIYVLFD